MSTVESICRSLGLLTLWQRLHIISADTVQTPGLTSTWTQDLAPVGDRAVAAGELVELYVTLEHDQPVAANPKLRFDVLEFDWLFFGGIDDPVVSLKTAAADPPEGEFTVLERELVEGETSADTPAVWDVVAAHRIAHPQDFERRMLVIRENDRPDIRRTHIIGWWRAQHADEDKPTLYFVADVDFVAHVKGARDSSTVPLRVDPPAPGASVRLYGRITDDEPADATLAQGVPRASVTVGGRTTSTDSRGNYVADVRLPLGTSTMRISRPGIEDRTITVQVTASSVGGGVDVNVLDPMNGNRQLHTGAVAADADPQSAHVVEVNLRTRVHRLRGKVRWPETRVAAAGTPPSPSQDGECARCPWPPAPPAPSALPRAGSWRSWRLGLMLSGRPGQVARGSARRRLPTESSSCRSST